MNYPVPTAIQLRPVLRALRQARGLSQAQAGQMLGVNQKRIAAIESAPGVTSFDQIARLVTALGGRLTIEASDAPSATAAPPEPRPKRKVAASAKTPRQGNW